MMPSLATLLYASLSLLTPCEHTWTAAYAAHQSSRTSPWLSANSGESTPPGKGDATPPGKGNPSETKGNPTATPPPLAVGASAPDVTFSKTYKGTEIQKLDPTKNYIVECWATWCGPCRSAFPHLSALAKELEGKVTVIGVNVDETCTPVEIQDFVDEQGDRMAYTVVSDPEGAVWRNWALASGQQGIPCAFVVIKGKITWIGNPTTLSTKTVLAWTEGKPAVPWVTIWAPIAKLLEEKKPGEALALLESEMAKHPEFAFNGECARFHMLLELDHRKACEQARKLLSMEEMKTNEIALYTTSTDLFNLDWDLALEYAARANALTSNTNPAYLWSQATCHAGKKDYPQAVKMMEQILVILKDCTPGQQRDRKFYEDELQKFKGLAAAAK